MGTYQTRFDAKGRMSVPAPFRNVLRVVSAEGGMSLILRRSHRYACVDAWPVPAFETMAGSLDRLDMFSADYDDLTTALYADAWPVEPDKEGRISVPESLVQHAGLTDSVVFMGMRQYFQIWEPQAASQRLDGARGGIATRGTTLPAART